MGSWLVYYYEVGYTRGWANRSSIVTCCIANEILGEQALGTINESRARARPEICSWVTEFLGFPHVLAKILKIP